MDVDEAMEHAGGWGRFQKILYVLVLLAGIPNAFIMMHFVFSTYVPDHHCLLPDALTNYTTNGTERDALAEFVIPNEADKDGEMRKTSCKMYNRNYSSHPVQDWSTFFNGTNDQITCKDGWEYDFEPYQKTAAAEFSMVCDEDWRVPLVVTIFTAGVAAGSLCGSLADRFGRRPVFLAAAFFQVVSMGVSAVSWDFYSYAISSFFGGMTSLINFVIAFALATEMASEEWRNFLAIGNFYSYAIGYCLVALLGYMFQDWRWYLGVTSILSLAIYLPNYWLLPESVRWLVQKGRKDDALILLRKMAKMNGRIGRFEKILEEKGEEIHNKKSGKSAGIIPTLRVLFRSGILIRCVTVAFIWFLVSLVYFSISYYSTSFSDNRFLNVFYAGIAEIPALAIGFYVVGVIGRPRAAFVLLLMCGTTSIILPFIGKDLHAVKTVLAMLGKGSVTAVFYIAYLMASEVAPTLERSSFMSICSFCARLGAFIAPFVMYIAKIHQIIPNLTMGVLSILCGFASLVLISETKGVNMPDTAEEARGNKRFYRLNLCKNFAGNTTSYRSGTQLKEVRS